jgi:hypothetical protein
MMKQQFSEEQLFRLAIALGVFTSFIALALYAYLGTFSRYGSDDYCLSAFFLQDNLISAMIERYFIASSRYTNIIFIGLADKLLGWHNAAILPALMLALFVLGLYLMLKEIGEMIELRWTRLLIFLLSLLLVFFSVSQAPDLYETLYWRAGMTSHFVPLTFIPFFGTFLLRQIRKSKERSPSLWIQAVCFIVPLLIGGLSEPPTALMITILSLAISTAWLWSDIRSRRSILLLLFWSLLAALTALIVMALAPANSIRMETPPPPFPELISRIISYPSFFIVDTLRTLPIPTLISVAVPAVLFYVKYAHSSESTSKEAPNRLFILMILVLIFTYLFIMASFAPSAYGQSYPAARGRFIGRLLLTGAFMTEGALLGALFSPIRIQFFQFTSVRGLAIFALMILALYPLRTAWRVFGEVPVYQQRAAAWDLRESEIYKMKAEGSQDLVVRFLRKERTQDLGDHANFRLNRCAAALYGVNSIVAMPMDD